MAGLIAVLNACNGSEKDATSSENPFFIEYSTPFGVPPFDKIKIEHYKPAFLKGMEEQKQEIETILNQRSMPDFENTIVALDRSGQLLKKVSSVFYGLNSAHTSEEMQALSKELAPLFTKHRDDIKLNRVCLQELKKYIIDRKNFV